MKNKVFNKSQKSAVKTATGTVLSTVLAYSIISALAQDACTLVPLPGQTCKAKGESSGGSCSGQCTSTNNPCSGSKTLTQYNGCNECKSGSSDQSCNTFYDMSKCDSAKCGYRSQAAACITGCAYYMPPACEPDPNAWQGYPPTWSTNRLNSCQ